MAKKNSKRIKRKQLQRTPQVERPLRQGERPLTQGGDSAEKMSLKRRAQVLHDIREMNQFDAYTGHSSLKKFGIWDKRPEALANMKVVKRRKFV